MECGMSRMQKSSRLLCELHAYEYERIADCQSSVRAGNPGFTRRQELDAINAWAHEQDPPLRPLNCFRSYSAYYWILISRKDIIDARVAELQDA
jgi:hypothetical protein